MTVVCTEGDRQIGPGLHRPEPGQRHLALLHERLDQPDRIKRGQAKEHAEKHGRPQHAFFHEGIPAEAYRLVQDSLTRRQNWLYLKVCKYWMHLGKDRGILQIGAKGKNSP